MTHAERLAEIKEREQAATAGPWVVEDWGYPESELMSIVAPPITCNPPRHEMFSGLGNPIIQDEKGECVTADMAFIAHARADIPYLLSRVEELEAEQKESSHDAR